MSKETIDDLHLCVTSVLLRSVKGRSAISDVWRSNQAGLSCDIQSTQHATNIRTDFSPNVFVSKTFHWKYFPKKVVVSELTLWLLSLSSDYVSFFNGSLFSYLDFTGWFQWTFKNRKVFLRKGSFYLRKDRNWPWRWLWRPRGLPWATPSHSRQYNYKYKYKEYDCDGQVSHPFQTHP